MNDYIKLYGKRDFIDAIKSRILNWGDYPGLYGQDHVITRETGRSESDKDTGRQDAAEFDNRGQGHKSRNAVVALEDRKGKKADSPPEPLEGTQSC